MAKATPMQSSCRTYLREAYNHAETFCKLLGERMQAAGFLKTLLLRRIGSTIHAGMTDRACACWTDWEQYRGPRRMRNWRARTRYRLSRRWLVPVPLAR
ncbi:MAG: hypothetical protein V9E88_15790 [Ferruginibacter sp.]